MWWKGWCVGLEPGSQRHCAFMLTLLEASDLHEMRFPWELLSPHQGQHELIWIKAALSGELPRPTCGAVSLGTTLVGLHQVLGRFSRQGLTDAGAEGTGAAGTASSKLCSSCHAGT